MRLNISKILEIIANLGITFTELSCRSGVSRQNISTIIRRGTCAPKTAGKLAVGLGVSVAEIMEG